MTISRSGVTGVERARAGRGGRALRAGAADVPAAGDPGRRGPEDPARPLAAQVWSWTEGVVLAGRGPSAADFL